MSEAELARGIHAVLAKASYGRHSGVGRTISDVIAELKARGSHAILDEDFSKDLETVIDSHREPLNAPA
jgi:hypothetical protein